MSLRRKVVRGAVWSVIGGNASQLITFAFFLLISRLVGPAAFGAVAIALAIVDISRSILIESLGSILIARKKYNTDDYDAALPIALGVSFLTSLILFAAAPLAAALYRMPELASVLAMLAWLLPLQAAARIQDAWLTRQMRFRSLAARAVGAAALGGAAGLAAAMQNMGASALVVQQAVTALTSCALVWLGSAWRPSFTIDWPRFKELARASATLTPASLVASATMLLDALAAGLSGATSAGIYGLAKRMRLALQFGLASALTRVVTPALAQTKAEGARLAALVEETTMVSMVIACPIFMGIAAIGPELIGVFLDARWSAAAVPLMFLLIAGPIVIAAHYSESTLLIAERRRTILWLKASTLAVLVIGLAIAAPYGVNAIAAVSLAAAIYNNAVFFWKASPLNALTPLRYARALGVPLLLGIAMIALVAAVREIDLIGSLSPLLRMPVLIAVGASFYIAGVALSMRPAAKFLHAAVRMIYPRA
jgi:O-antigen/teichoic acid export membrane protein